MTSNDKNTKTKKPSAQSTKKQAETPGPSGKDIARHVGPEQYFFLSDGRPLKSLLELADAFEDMTDDIFKHHVTDAKNDFAKWVQDVFGDEGLAIRLGQSKSRQQHQLIILKHLVRRLAQ